MTMDASRVGPTPQQFAIWNAADGKWYTPDGYEVSGSMAMLAALAPDARGGNLTHGSVTISGGVGQVAVPAGARGVQLYGPASNAADVIFAIDENPSASVGGRVRNNGVEQARLLAPGVALVKFSGTNGDVVQWEFF